MYVNELLISTQIVHRTLPQPKLQLRRVDPSSTSHSILPLSLFTFTPYPPLDNIRVMVIVWRLRGNIIRTAPCWVVRHNVHSQQQTHMSSSYRSSRLDLSHWDPYAVHRGGCLEL